MLLGDELFFHIEWSSQKGKLQKLTDIFKKLTPKLFLSFFQQKKKTVHLFCWKKRYIILCSFVGGQNVALLISLHANRGSGADPFGTTDTLMREPPKRQGAKRRQRCQDEAWKIFGRLMQQVGFPWKMEISIKHWMGPYQRTPKEVARAIRFSGLRVRSVGPVGVFLENCIPHKNTPL